MEQREDLGHALRGLRELRGEPSYRSIARSLTITLGAYGPSDQTVANWHAGKVDPQTGDLVIAGALADYYGAVLSDLHPVFAERWNGVRDLLIGVTGCFDTVAA